MSETANEFEVSVGDARWLGRCQHCHRRDEVKVIEFTVGSMLNRLCRSCAKKLSRELSSEIDRDRKRS